MGGKDEKEVTTNIRNVAKSEVYQIIKNKIKNFTTSLNNLVSQAVFEHTIFLVNMIKNNSRAKAAAKKLLEDVTLVASSGGRIDLKQDANAQLEMAAVMQILSKDSNKDEIIGKVIQVLEASIKNNPKFKDQMIQAGKIQEMAKIKGGVFKMIDNLVNKLLLRLEKSTIKNLIGGFDQNTVLKERTRMSRELENEINNTKFNIFDQNNLVDYTKKKISYRIRDLTINDCLRNAKARNMEKKLKLLAGPGAKIKVLEVAGTDAIAKCISTRNIGRHALSGLSDYFFESMNYGPTSWKTYNNLGLAKSKETRKMVTEYHEMKNRKPLKENNVRSMIRRNIVNTIAGNIEEFTKNLNNIFSNSTMRVSNEMVNEFKNETNAQTTAEKLLEDITIVASRGAEININNDKSAMLEMAAIVNILSSNEQKNRLANNVSAILEYYIENDSRLKSQFLQVGKIDEMVKRKGSFGYLIDHLVNKFSGMSQKSVRSKLNNEINNTIFNKTNFVNKITTEIKKLFKNMTEDECLGSAKSRNMAKKLKLLAGTGAKIRVLQISKADSIAKCISRKKIGNIVLNELINDTSYEYYLNSYSNDSSILQKNFKMSNNNVEALTGVKGSGYRGYQNKTKSGKTCMNWKSQSPHKHSVTNEKFPNKGIGNHNFCRNPDNEDTIWCYTTDKNTRWEYCEPLEESKMKEMNKKITFKVKNKKIVIDKKILNEKQKKVLNFINKKGVYHIKINKKVLFKTLKLEEIVKPDKINDINKQFNMMVGMHSMMLPKLLEVGLYSKIDQDKISFYLPQFLLEKDNLEANINTFFNLIKPKNDHNNDTAIMIKNIVIKFFTRLNRDNKGKHIFANMVDSIVKLGISFILPALMNGPQRLNQKALLSNVEYFSDFIIENMVTLVSDRCRLNSVRKDLLENGSSCTPKKLVDECPKCPELKCPKPVCPTPSCPEIPQPSCPEIPAFPEIPKCPEVPKCPEIPAPICPKPNLNVYYGIIGALVLIVIIILFTRKSVTKIVKK